MRHMRRGFLFELFINANKSMSNFFFNIQEARIIK